MVEIKERLRNILRKSGFDVVRADELPVGRSPYRDTRVIFGDEYPLVVFDVGANVGDVTHEFLQNCNVERIYSFEPAPRACAQLSGRFQNNPKVSVVNCGLGSTAGTLELSDFGGLGCMNSFLPKGGAVSAAPIATHTVEVQTIDQFCAQMSVPRISVLKIDAQGFDLEVLKGASNMIASGNVSSVLVELIFTNYYEGQASAGQIVDWLSANNFWPLCFYPMHFTEGRGVWLDGMFVHNTRRLAHLTPALSGSDKEQL